MTTNASGANDRWSPPLIADEELVPGTQLIIRCRGYQHHGIYAGDRRVVHYAGRVRYPQGLIEEVSLTEFIDGCSLSLGHSPDNWTCGGVIVRRARSRLGERRYDIFRNNCEHFCNWCRAGEQRSEQIESLRWPLRIVIRTLEGLASIITAATWAAANSSKATSFYTGVEARWRSFLSRVSCPNGKLGSGAMRAAGLLARRWSVQRAYRPTSSCSPPQRLVEAHDVHRYHRARAA